MKAFDASRASKKRKISNAKLNIFPTFFLPIKSLVNRQEQKQTKGKIHILKSNKAYG